MVRKHENLAVDIPLHWNADENDRRFITDEGVIDHREHDADPLTGDFVPDFIRNCHLLGVTPHPHLTGECNSVGAIEAREHGEHNGEQEPQSSIQVMGWKLDKRLFGRASPHSSGVRFVDYPQTVACQPYCTGNS